MTANVNRPDFRSESISYEASMWQVLKAVCIAFCLVMLGSLPSSARDCTTGNYHQHRFIHARPISESQPFRCTRKNEVQNKAAWDGRDFKSRSGRLGRTVETIPMPSRRLLQMPCRASICGVLPLRQSWSTPRRITFSTEGLESTQTRIRQRSKFFSTLKCISQSNEGAI